MSKNTTTAATTFDEFRAAVKYVLIQQQGTPDLVAEALLAAYAEYLEEAYADCSSSDTVVMEVATELALKPPNGSGWVQVSDDQLIVDVNEKIRAYLNELLAIGIYGASLPDIARLLFCRGIESTLQTAPVLKRRGGF